jgi:hypothetical protein
MRNAMYMHDKHNVHDPPGQWPLDHSTDPCQGAGRSKVNVSIRVPGQGPDRSTDRCQGRAQRAKQDKE